MTGLPYVLRRVLLFCSDWQMTPSRESSGRCSAFSEDLGLSCDIGPGPWPCARGARSWASRPLVQPLPPDCPNDPVPAGSRRPLISGISVEAARLSAHIVHI